MSRRYAVNKPIIITTNQRFAEWNETFPNSACVVTLIDRLVHRSEIVPIAGKSYRLKESKEQSASRCEAREVSDQETSAGTSGARARHRCAWLRLAPLNVGAGLTD